MKTFFVVNPKSGNGETGRRWLEIESRLKRSLGEVGHGFTERAMHAEELARRALHEGYDTIVAVGGDGTINETVNGFFENGKLLNDKASFGVVPRGTGGDFRRTFGWDLEVESACERLRRDAGTPFDLGLLDFTGHDGSPQKRYFANIASFGISGVVDQEVNRASKALGGKLSFMWGSVKALVKYKDKPVRYRLDGGVWQEANVTTLAVANGKFFGGGMKVAPDAETADGIFDVTVWSGYGMSDFMLKQQGIYSGAHVTWKGTTCARAKVVEAESSEEVLIDCDGEQPGRLPCKMTVLPSAIRLKV